MEIKCAACQDYLGDTETITLENALLDHVCLASDQDYETALTWVKFNQIIDEQGL